MSTEQQRNSALVREAWGKWHECKGADLSLWDSYMAEDIHLFSLADGGAAMPFATSRSGIEQVHLYLEGLTSAFAMDHWHIDQTVAEGDRVIAIGSTGWTNKQTGKAFVTPIVIVTRWRDGKMTEYGEYYDTAMVAASAS